MIENRPTQPSDSLKWIDTLVMCADCLTKSMKEDLLVKVIQENHWSFKQHDDALAVKRRRQSQRKNARDKKHAASTTGGQEPERLDASDTS